MDLRELPRNIQSAIFASMSRNNRRGEEQSTGLGLLVQQTRAIGQLLWLKGLSYEDIAKQVQIEIAKLITQFIATFEASLELTLEQEKEIVKQVQAEIIRQAYEEIMAQAPEEAEKNAISSEQLIIALTEGTMIFNRRSNYDWQVLQLNSVIIHFDKTLQRLIGQDIELEISLASDIGWINCDLRAITQLISHLVINARDAMPNGGRLVIETANVALDEADIVLHSEVRPGEYVLLTIQDTGCGISDEIKEKIFDASFTTKNKDHPGFGLAIVSGIVNLHGGQIQVHSQVGVGSTFKIYLPKVAQPPPLTPLPNLLEANPGVCNLIQQKLADLGKKL